MPSPKAPSSRGRLADKSMSFHGKESGMVGVPGTLRRPKTLPDLRGGGGVSLLQQQASPSASNSGGKKLTKLLLKVTIQGSLGPVQVLINPESTVADLITATLTLYVKEGRRPVLSTPDPSTFDLHYSQFSLESLDRAEKLGVLGSRNFFLCKKSVSDPPPTASAQASCSTQAEKAARTGRFGLPWLKFIGLMQ